MNTDRTIPFEDMALPGDVQPATCDSYTPNTTGDYCADCGRNEYSHRRGHKHNMYPGTIHALDQYRNYGYCPECGYNEFQSTWDRFRDTQGHERSACSTTCGVCNNTMPASGCKDCTQTHDRKGTK